MPEGLGEGELNQEEEKLEEQEEDEEGAWVADHWEELLEEEAEEEDIEDGYDRGGEALLCE